MKKWIKKLAALILALCVLLVSLPASALQVDDLPFRDIWVWPDSTYNGFIARALECGIMYGTSPTTFSPDRPVTRGESVTILGRVQEEISGEKLVQVKPATFPDVPAGSYYGKYAAWAQEQGIAAGYGDGTFRPGKAVTNSELAVMLYRYLRAIGKDSLYPPQQGLSYKDKASIPGWALPAVTALSGFDIFTSDLFQPADPVLRKEAALLVVRMFEKATYPIDTATPRQKFTYSLPWDDEHPWRYEENFTILGSMDEYTAFMQGIQDEAREGSFEEEPQPAALTVNEGLFQEYNLLALEKLVGGSPGYGFDFAGMETVGGAARLTFTGNGSLSSTADNIGILHIVAVPITVTAGEVNELVWTDWYDPYWIG